ncbi:MAG TPA: AAA family ATPase [Vicinamibacteria bacterium]|nr:AAA family ATPase [Vicinamibacteria bacterium]
MRAELRASLLLRAREGPALLVTGPPGAGKTTLLLELAALLSREGAVPVYLDLFTAASSPERFVGAALRALPVESFGARLPQALEIRRLADGGRERGAEAVQALLRLLASLDDAQGRRVVLLLDEVTEIRSLAYFAGLRGVHEPFAAALRSRRRGTLLASSFPTAARRLWSFESQEMPPLTAEELRREAGNAADAIAAASFGWPRYARVLLDARPRSSDDVADAWATGMALGGRLEVLARATHESLLLRSRGYGISKAVLQAVAHEEGLNLTALVPRLGRTPGAVRDYLQWLVGVDALRMVKKRYVYVDGLLRLWVRLHGRGTPATPAEVEAVARALVATDEALPVEAAEAAPAVPDAVVSRRDSLIEID